MSLNGYDEDAESYKVYSQKVREPAQASEWMTETEARALYNKLRNDSNVWWADIFFIPLDESKPQKRIAGFTNKVFDFGELGVIVVNKYDYRC